ncbi:hypothetical protein BCR35DRAFT_107766 [Leucosporidium creatinivorum]|uniref:Uncharacterized protein n=1 Tax=Leucosporidium creatinivorum TaxID=106004 RepID=A0A1Y2G3D2_9BASI|nr:hypothetical protein BCR35DRAFT_107766 [Leucosporidium creatinivorum]
MSEEVAGAHPPPKRRAKRSPVKGSKGVNRGNGHTKTHDEHLATRAHGSTASLDSSESRSTVQRGRRTTTPKGTSTLAAHESRPRPIPPIAPQQYPQLGMHPFDHAPACLTSPSRHFFLRRIKDDRFPVNARELRTRAKGRMREDEKLFGE